MHAVNAGKFVEIYLFVNIRNMHIFYTLVCVWFNASTNNVKGILLVN